MVACVELSTRCDGSFALSSTIAVVIVIVLIIAPDYDDAQCTMHIVQCNDNAMTATMRTKRTSATISMRFHHVFAQQSFRRRNSHRECSLRSLNNMVNARLNKHSHATTTIFDEATEDIRHLIELLRGIFHVETISMRGRTSLVASSKCLLHRSEQV